VIGAFAGGWLRQITPRAALLSSLAGIAITFISMGFVFQIFASPLIAIVPAFMILAAYGGKLRLPLGLPGGFVAVCVGVLIAWLGRWFGFGGFEPAAGAVNPGFHPPIPHLGEVIGFLTQPTGWKYLAVIFPMGLFNVIGSLQCLESAEAAGDRFSTRSSLLMNGAGTLLAAAFGSAFPTTIYIGHPGWKAMGARAGYSTLNGIVIALLCVSGLFDAVLNFVPLEVTLGILLWIGVIITAQAFQEVPRSHALGVAVGFIPSLAAWALLLVETSLRVAGMSLQEAVSKFGGNLYIDGVIALNQGFILSSMILATIMVFATERKFVAGACWLIAGAVLSALGVIHAYELTPSGVENKFGLMAAPKFAISYAIAALVFLALGWLSNKPAKVE
jgi:AGZA family xanthine/uracil permease-like MFS transporter